MAQADAHACLLDALGLRTVVVIGGSAGAPSSMQFCLRHPDRCSSMVLLFPLAYFPHPAGEKQQQPSALMLFVMNTTLKSDFLFWVATKLAPDVMMRTILATPVEDFRKAGCGTFCPSARAREDCETKSQWPVRFRGTNWSASASRPW